MFNTDEDRCGLSDKQVCFCLEYLKDFNASRAAISAGYSERSARSVANRMLTKDNRIREFIEKQKEKIEKSKIMDIQEIQERLTAIARGEVDEDVVVTENIGDFMSKAKIMQKKMAGKEQVKALELLGKANSLFKENVTNNVSVTSRFEEFNNFMGAIKSGNLQKK